MLNYTKEQLDMIRNFADEQFRHACETDFAGDYIFVTSEEFGINVINPWIDSSARFELSDEGAIDEWGIDLVRSFCESVLDHLK